MIKKLLIYLLPEFMIRFLIKLRYISRNISLLFKVTNIGEKCYESYNRVTGIKISSGNLSQSDDLFQDELPSSNKTDKDKKLLERICNAYELSKKDQPQKGTYAVSGQWELLLQSQYQEMILAAKEKDIDKLDMILKNVFKQGSIGLSMSGGIPDLENHQSVENYLNLYVDDLLRLATFLKIPEVVKDLDNELYIFENKISWEFLWDKICKRIEIDFSYPKVGNPFGVIFNCSNNKCVIPRVAFRHLYIAFQAHKILKEEMNPNIIEVGGGFGGVIFYITKLLKTNFIFKSMDIPEINIISSYFLSKALPDIPVSFYGEKTYNSKSENKISVLPNWALQDIPSKSISLVLNADSLPEMSYETIIEYIKRISEISKYFYSFNHDSGKSNEKYRLSQINFDELGLKSISYAIAWVRRGYFEHLYKSKIY